MAEFAKGQTLYLRNAPPRYSRQPGSWGEVREAQVRMFKEGYVYLTNREGKFDTYCMEIEDREGQTGTRVFTTRQEAEDWPEIKKEWDRLRDYVHSTREPVGVSLAQVREAAQLLAGEEKS